MSRRAALVALTVLVLSRLAASVADAAGAGDLNEAGKQAYQRGDHARAEQLFGQAIAQAPSDPLLHYHRGIALSRLSRWAEAARSYETALRLNPPPALAASIREALRSAAPFVHPGSRIARPSEDIAIPLQRAGGGWLAEVMVNGTRSARFLVDTGASVCVIDPALARELGIVATAEARTCSSRRSRGARAGRSSASRRCAWERSRVRTCPP